MTHERQDSSKAMKVVEGYPTERREGDLEILLRRAHGMISHDLCHFFGMSNCQFYICRMQGSSGLHESDTNQDKVHENHEIEEHSSSGQNRS